MKKEDPKAYSARCIKQFTNNRDHFDCKVDVDVYEDGELKVFYRNISCYINHQEGQLRFDVSLYWEEDSVEDDDYKSLDLHGNYNTDYQVFSYINQELIIEDSLYDIHIRKA